ncbi:MAG TPA: hypothetical protein VGM77_04440 [Gemmatimonadales bacterium]
MTAAKTYLRELKTQGSTRYGGFGERLYEYVARHEGQTGTLSGSAA